MSMPKITAAMAQRIILSGNLKGSTKKLLISGTTISVFFFGIRLLHLSYVEIRLVQSIDLSSHKALVAIFPLVVARVFICLIQSLKCTT
jgi:hypothetical protein